jgi:EAL domain-containing protein (putative c-di-GMP-specific phosphodiesterase class I)
MQPCITSKTTAATAGRVTEPRCRQQSRQNPVFFRSSQALERDQFELWYQPTWYAQEKTIHGFEALLRWRHPEQGVVLPGLFIPSLEQTGLIIPVGNWAIEAACRQLHFWTEQGSASGRYRSTYPPSSSSSRTFSHRIVDAGKI